MRRQLLLQGLLIALLACGGDDEPRAPAPEDAGSRAEVDASTSDESKPDDVEAEDAAAIDVADALDAAGDALDATVTAMLDAGDAAQDAARAEIDVATRFGCVLRKNNTPDTLECTGLYESLETKQVSGAVREFRPAVALWSNGADKTRWIYLPPGTTINAENPREWVFPVGTKFWKEFRVGGRRIETRFLNKIGTGNWLRGAYRWSADELSAVRYDSVATEVFSTADGTQYHIPTPTQCDDCHNGRQDFVMGFESILLGLDGAAGITLERLANEGLLSPKPEVTHYMVSSPDGGSDDATRAVTWLHANCGVSCHNTNPKAKANSFDLHLRLNPDQLATGAAPDGSWDVIASTVNVATKSKTGAGGMRIVPHQPDASLLVQLISGSPAMPYLDTVQVNLPDPAAIQFVRAWIAAMPADADAGVSDAGASDAGAPDTGPGFGDGGRPGGDAGREAGAGDAGAADSSAPDAAAPDTGEPEPDAAVDGGCGWLELDGACLG